MGRGGLRVVPFGYGRKQMWHNQLITHRDIIGTFVGQTLNAC